MNEELVIGLTIPEEVAKVNDYAFYNCCSLVDIVLADGVGTIGQSAFCGCGNVETLYISSTINSIGSSAFARCYNIDEIKIGAVKPIRGSADIFTDTVYDNATLYVPNGTEPLYQKREPWNLFFYIVETDFTGVEELKAEGGNVKAIYDLQGKKIEVPSKGLYIINGKKVLIK